MQEYLQKTRFSGIIDGIGFHFLSIFVSFAWFIFLWGLRLPALTAGIALYGIIVLLRKTIRDDQVARKERELRCVIGGELALERLLLTPSERADFEIAMLLSMRYALIMLQSTEHGILCDLKGKKLLVAFVQQPEKTVLSSAQVLDAQRNAKLLRADCAVLCCPCGISQDAKERGLWEPPVYFVSRDKLISLFGAANPATDDQLIQLGKRKKQRAANHLELQILHPSKGKKYACYGILLLIMYQFTHLIYYALPGLICVFLAAACRCTRNKQNTLFDLFSTHA